MNVVETLKGLVDQSGFAAFFADGGWMSKRVKPLSRTNTKHP